MQCTRRAPLASDATQGALQTHRSVRRVRRVHTGHSLASDAHSHRGSLTWMLTSYSVRRRNSVQTASDVHPSDGPMQSFYSRQKPRVHQTLGQRPTPPRLASGECPQLHQIFHRCNRKICTSFSQKRQILPRKLGGKERETQTPLYPSNSTSFSKCANTTMCKPTSAHVLAFSQSFSLKELS